MTGATRTGHRGSTPRRAARSVRCSPIPNSGTGCNSGTGWGGGFTAVAGYREAGQALTAESRRMIVTASR